MRIDIASRVLEPRTCRSIRHRGGTDERRVACFDVSVAPPTVRQIYALAAALCERSGKEFPATREIASESIERLRAENGHPAPRLQGAAPRGRGPRQTGLGTRKLARAIAAEVARELK
jgi:hypothetical protein